MTKKDEFHKEMSWEEYLTYPRQLGWKYEYFGDALHLSPSSTAISKLCISLENLQCGFVEVPCIWTAGHRANIYLQEAERQERLGQPTAATTRELANYWADQRKRLDADSRMLDN